LKEIFILQTKLKKPLKHLLIINSYRSHYINNFLYKYYKNNIYLLFLLLYSSYVLQPLNILIFSLIKVYYRQALADYLNLKDSTLYSKIVFL
ncbi:hypothetical protein M441DRAFT_154645, partial [Trichoderma asperellum CBS 433.97]